MRDERSWIFVIGSPDNAMSLLQLNAAATDRRCRLGGGARMRCRTLGRWKRKEDQRGLVAKEPQPVQSAGPLSLTTVRNVSRFD